MKLKFKQLDNEAKLPTFATEGSACFDLCAIDGYEIPPNGIGNIATGLAVEIPESYCMQVFPRSGNAFKHRINLINNVGIIDFDYRGEIRVGLFNNDPYKYFRVNKGDRIAQAMLVSLVTYEMELVVEELSNTVRGEGGFGSTGK